MRPQRSSAGVTRPGEDGGVQGLEGPAVLTVPLRYLLSAPEVQRLHILFRALLVHLTGFAPADAVQAVAACR